MFDMTDVWTALATKIVRRHPHVFGEAEARTASDVNRQWERIKQGERAAAAAATARSRRAAPSTASAARCPRWRRARRCRSGRRTWATTGRRIDGVLDKVREEVGELVEAENDAQRAEELGDLLFVLVNVGRKTDIEVEAALRVRQRQVPPAVPARRAVRGVPRHGPARHDLRGAGCALGRRQGGRARGGDGMSIGNQPPAAGGGDAGSATAGTCGRTVDSPATCARWRSRSGSRSGPRGRASSGSATPRCCARRPSRTASRRTSAARARAGSPARTRCSRARRPSAPSARAPRARSAGGRTRSSGWSGGPCAASSTWRGSASGRSPWTATSSSPTAAPGPRRSPAATSPSRRR